MIDATALIYDNGLFTELAVRLSRDFERVLYYSEWEDEFPTVNDVIIGDGLPNITRVEDPLDPKHGVNLFIFPDIFRGGTQLFLESIGKKVWGSRHGDELETRRIWFRELQQKLGLPVPEYVVKQGVTELREFLKNHGHCFVKCTSRFRGTMETWEHKDYDQSEYILDNLAVKFGGAKELVKFIVEDPIESEFETGFDTYCIDGQFTETPIQGIEVKGKLILCSAQTNSVTPDFIDEAMQALAPTLKECRYRNFMSAEFRQDILIDPCCRAPNPGIGCEMEMISNLGEIIWKGAGGELVQPEYEYEFGIQAAIFHDHHEELWKQFRIPEDVRRWVKLMEFCRIEDRYQIVPRPPHGQKIGWVIGVGNTIQEASDHLKQNAKALKDLPLDIKLDALEEAIKQVHQAEKEGIEFTDGNIPEPQIALDN